MDDRESDEKSRTTAGINWPCALSEQFGARKAACKEKPGFYAGLKNDPRQTGECLSRDVHANSGWGNVLVSHR